ncbi:MAG: hypothetical protein JNL87_05175 [Burkholderiaceae bacterium]|nr:hypothetical protein [Burkholderiaceae bacterium]
MIFSLRHIEQPAGAGPQDDGRRRGRSAARRSGEIGPRWSVEAAGDEGGALDEAQVDGGVDGQRRQHLDRTGRQAQDRAAGCTGAALGASGVGLARRCGLVHCGVGMGVGRVMPFRVTRLQALQARRRQTGDLQALLGRRAMLRAHRCDALHRQGQHQQPDEPGTQKDWHIATLADSGRRCRWAPAAGRRLDRLA